MCDRGPRMWACGGYEDRWWRYGVMIDSCSDEDDGGWRHASAGVARKFSPEDGGCGAEICLSPKTTAWNEFSSTIASAIVCLATNKVFNFSKLIFDGMIKNLDNVSSNILMYPRFIQIFLDKQLDELPTHMEKYDAPFHTKKVFANMRKIGKDFSGRVTPLFPTMVTQKPRKTKRKTTKVPQPSGSTDIVVDEAVLKEGGDSLVRATTTASSLEAKQGSDDESLDKEDASKQGRIADIDDNEEITLVSTTHDDVDEHVDDTVVDNIVEDVIEEEVVEDIITAKLIVDVSTTGDQEVSAVIVPVSATAPIITNVQPTGATKTVKITTAPKVRGISIQEQEESTTKTSSSQQPQLQVEIDKEDRLEREKSQHKVEENEALINTWDDIQAKIDADA
ncbi:hypothetical protein Tco_1157130 [Tanacetum coccineum]